MKCFVEGDIAFHLDALVPVFQRWIQQHIVEGLLIDVADYKHVFQGPGVLLIGHEGDYSFDLKDGRPGLRYTRKQALQGSLADDLSVAFRLASAACKKLESEQTLRGIRFNNAEAEMVFLDRLNTPNTPEAFESIRSALLGVASALYQTKAVQVNLVEADPRKPLTVHIAATPESVAK